MSAAPKFWADKLDKEQQVTFWHLVNEWGFSGETAFCRTRSGAQIYRKA